jgi:glyoxylase-like metal-dependent hydrolase (beta-lactamase superfamily II)
MAWGPLRFEAIWTPGHSAGLICLYAAQTEVLISSDHVLQRISPHISMGSQHDGDPLADYLRSLQTVRNLPTRTVLPGHGKPFTNLAERVDELIEHHQIRLQTILKALASDKRTAYQVASLLPWRRSQHGWQQLSIFERMSAADETLAHLEYLANQEQIKKYHRDDGVVTYQTLASSPRSLP